MAYEVKLDVYEGPIGLLLSLIQAQSVDVYQISLTSLVGDFLSEIERRKQLDLEVATEFVLVAATLLEIKCRRLLPGDDLSDLDEETAFDDERDVLLARLLEAKTYRDISQVLSSLLTMGQRRLFRRVGLGPEVAHLMPDPLDRVSAEGLLAAYEALMARQSDSEMPATHVTPLPPMSLDQAREKISAHLGKVGVSTFDALVSDSSTRIEVVMQFLGILELYKLGEIEISQQAAFETITLQRLS